MASLPPATANPNDKNKEVVFKNSAQFTDCISEINNRQRDDAKDIDVVILHWCSYSIEYSNNYSKNIRKFMAIL